jgi:hypothetical protein
MVIIVPFARVGVNRERAKSPGLADRYRQPAQVLLSLPDYLASGVRKPFFDL